MSDRDLPRLPRVQQSSQRDNDTELHRIPPFQLTSRERQASTPLPQPRNENLRNHLSSAIPSPFQTRPSPPPPRSASPQPRTQPYFFSSPSMQEVDASRLPAANKNSPETSPYSEGMRLKRSFDSAASLDNQVAQFNGVYSQSPQHSMFTSKAESFAESSSRPPIPTPTHQQDQKSSFDAANFNSPPFNTAPEYSPSAAPMLQRKKTVRRLQLQNGNLVIDCPVPDRLLNNVPYKNNQEFSTMRYTAVTCDPDDFINQRFTLRQVMYRRHTELFAVVTMYNEDEVLFAKTMSSVMKNIAYLSTRSRSSVWGENSWQRAVVCIVADGRNKIDPRVLEVLGIMGVYQKGVAKSEVNGLPVQAHLYEYTTQVCVEPDLQVCGAEKGYVPVQVLFCLKEQNKKKLNSHRWFFNAFAPLLRPNVCILLDAGTKPTNTSFYHLWKAFDSDDDVAGACGEIATDCGPYSVNLFNPLVAAQNFEYKMSNILDKPLESIFGYISVLPGAFSAYRYVALLNTAPGIGPLASYFQGEEKPGMKSESIFKANMYLAEDRILCFELVAKAHSSWILKYVKAAKAETDVPGGIPEFISQRRRWMNGSFFVADCFVASTYALFHWSRIWNTDHSLMRKLWFQVQFFYNLVSILFSWFSLANFYLTFYFLSQNAIGTSSNSPFISNGVSFGSLIFQLFREVYIFAIVVIFISSLGNRPQGSKWIYVTCVILFAIIMVLMLYLSAFTIISTINTSITLQQQSDPNVSLASAVGNALLTSPAFRGIFLSMMSTYGFYIAASLMHCDPWHLLTSSIQYILFLPSFINILMVYGFCNTHDISWGTKGDNKPANLGAAKLITNASKKGSGGVEEDAQVDVELPFEDHKDKARLNEDYDGFLISVPQPPPRVPVKRDDQTKKDDWHRNFRTRLVLLWAFTNSLLIVILTGTSNIIGSGDPNSVAYLTFIFWTVAALSFIRFCGSLFYTIQYWSSCCCSCRW